MIRQQWMPTALIKISLSIRTVWRWCSLSIDIFCRTNESVGRQQKSWYIQAETGRPHVHTWKGSNIYRKRSCNNGHEEFSKYYQLIIQADRPCWLAWNTDNNKNYSFNTKLASKICSRRHFNFLNFFQRKEVLTFHVNRLLGRWFTWHAKTYFLWKKKCHLLQLW